MKPFETVNYDKICVSVKLQVKKETKTEILAKAYKDHEQALLKRSFYKINNHDLADDLVQTTFLKTWEYLLKHGEIDHIKGFLFHVLNRLITDEYRKKKKVSLDSLLKTGFQVSIDDSEKMFNQIDGKSAMLLIPLLEDKYEKVISMRFEEEMTIKEIALATKQPENTVVVQIHRGIDKLAILIKVNKKNI
jgi:RNA polymerase sigma-70 factor, ECF subfamily